MTKYIIIINFLIVVSSISGCKDDDKDVKDLNTSCSGSYVFRDGYCQCPENSVDMGRSFCSPYSNNNFWIQEGDACLGQAFIFFGRTGKDLIDENQSTIEMRWSQGPEAARLSGFVNFDKIDDKYYLITNKFEALDHSTNDFGECVGVDYEYYDMEIKIDLEWTTADVTYKFWNDIDTSIHIKKEFGKELKAKFMSNTGPKKR